MDGRDAFFESGAGGMRVGLVGTAVLVLVLLVAAQPVLGQTVPDFEDVPEGHIAEDAIRWAAEEGITFGVGNNQFGLGQALTRYQMVTFLCRGFALDACGDGTRGSDSFEDVPVDHWANYPIGWAVDNGITSGVSATEFGGSRTLTREQIAAFLYRAKVPQLGDLWEAMFMWMCRLITPSGLTDRSAGLMTRASAEV